MLISWYEDMFGQVYADNLENLGLNTSCHLLCYDFISHYKIVLDMMSDFIWDMDGFFDESMT
jgi:hypothetical protein